MNTPTAPQGGAEISPAEVAEYTFANHPDTVSGLPAIPEIAARLEILRAEQNGELR